MHITLMAILRSSFIPSFVIFTSLISSLISIVRRRLWPVALPRGLLELDLAARIRADSEAIVSASADFGRLVTAAPAAVLYPSSTDDVAALVRFSYASLKPFTVAARGHGHSVRGQALAPGGVVVEMRSLADSCMDGKGRIVVSSSEKYVDAGGEQLWVDVLRATLEHGLAPRSWTDYLYLTVGGTLSNGGVSGQAFLHGPQIANVFELDVITGTGEMVTCSEHLNHELFYAVLGGLGQFGIITRARIALEPSPHRVKWVRLIYVDFHAFTKDQEHLISKDGREGHKKKGFHYVEGSLLMDQSVKNNWRSSFFTGLDMEKISDLGAQHGVVYCLEGAMYYDLGTASSVDQELKLLLEELSFIPGFAFSNDVAYFHFLNRVRDGELKLRSMGLWDAPNPWLSIFVPKSRIYDFNQGVFRSILKHNSSLGPIIIYPMSKNKWDERMSAVIPEEEIFYSIAILRSAVHGWERLEDQNMEILQYCDQASIEYKQYLPHYTTQVDWMRHFGPKWEMFFEMKKKYDPKAILSPGQKIFSSSLVDLLSDE